MAILWMAGSRIAQGADSVLVFNEIQYNPADPATQTEWVELRSLQAVDVDIGGWRIEGGIDFTFPNGTVMPGLGYIVVAAQQGQIAGSYGPFVGQLDNGGETIRLVNRNGRVMDELSYDDENDWPLAPDGSGCTLARISASAQAGPAMWSASPVTGGTPGAANTAVPAPTLVFSEISPAADPSFFIELQNKSASVVSTTGWIIRTSTGLSYPLPSETVNSGAFVSFTAESLGLTPADGMRLYLFSAATVCRDAREITARLRGLTSEGRWGHPDSLTPGAENVVTLSTEIVINEIFYHGLNGSPEQWIELHNRSVAPVNVGGWKFTDGISFDIPANTTIAAGGFLVIAWDPAAFATLHSGVTALGPFSGNLSNSGELLTLRDQNDNVADQLTYADGGRWPSWADGGGSSLELRDPRADNSKGEAWDASDESSKSSWVTVASGTYQGLGANSNSPDPTNYNEFVFGLLDSGEFLIDDISVKNVSLGNVEMIQNGTFESGAATAWRIIGTHSGTVIDDPTGGGGKVLKVSASGATEHMHNHAETTLKVGASYVNIDPAHTYNITFRAKWLRGSNRLHTRLWHNRLPRQTQLNMPTTGGTPGAPNGATVANIGPTFDSLAVAPVVPFAAQGATVTIRVSDPDNVAGVSLFTSVNGAGFTSAAMTALGNGLYSGAVTGKAAGTLVQFYVQATDSLGGTTFFPPAGPASRAMIPWNDGRAQLTLGTGAKPHNIRVVLPTADATELYKSENLMSDGAVPCTVILDEATAFYRAGVRLRSSEHGRISEARCGYTLEFPSDDLFLGIHDTIGVDRSGGTVTGQREILLKRLQNTAGGIIAPEDDICRVISAIGTAPGRFTGSGITGAAILSKTRLDKEYLDAQFPNGGDGAMNKYERVYVLTETINPATRAIATPAAGTAAVEFPKVPQDTTSPPGVNVTSLGANKEAYRWYWLLQNARESDAFTGIINVTNAVGQTGGSASFNSLVDQHINVNAWLRASIPATLYGVQDNYLGKSNAQHNALIYFPPGQKALLIPWDMDFLDQSSGQITAPLVGSAGDLNKFTANPVWRRLFYGHVHDLLNRTFNDAYMRTWATHYNRFGTDDMLSQVTAFLTPRANNAAAQITAAIPSVSFTRTSASPVTVSTPFTTVTGTGWVNVAEIRLQGTNAPLNVTWTGQTTWSLQLPVKSGTNTYTLEAYDYSGVLISSISVTVNGAGGVFLANPGDLAVTEVNYHPANPTAAELAGNATLQDSDFEFIELKNIATTSVDLSGLQVQVGVSYTFANGALILQPGEYVIIAANPTAFAARYGSVSRVVGPFSDDLANGDDQLVIRSAANAVIANFTYEDAWYSATDGGGRTLEAVDQGQLNFPAGWRASFRVNGTPGFEDVPPAISAGPDDATLNPGMPLNLTVTFSGSPTPTVQWRKNLVPIDGATNSTFMIQSVAEGDEGNYDVVVSSLAGQATSNPAIVSVNDPVVFSQHPESKTVNSGTMITFTVAVSGTGPFSYQWRKNTQPIDGATNPSLSMTATAGDEGAYDVVVSNVVGSATSNAATLSVNVPVQITGNPQDKTVNPATEVRFSVSVNGTGPFMYQWRKGGVPIPGAEGSEFVIASAAEGDEGSYDVVVANVVGANTSAPALLSVNDPVQITGQPKSRVVSPGQSTTFSVTATGTETLEYQWYFNDVPIAGATGPSHQVAAAATTDIGEYKVVVTNVVGAVTSTPVSLSFIDWPGTAGTFQGALVRENATDLGLVYPGRVTLTVAKTGKFTGKVEHLGMSHSFKGQFDLDLHSDVAVKRGNEVPLGLVLDLSSEPQKMTAEVAQPGIAEPAIAEMPQIPKRPRAQPAARAGRYTMLLKPGSQGPEGLKGLGFLAVNVAKSGAVSWAGKLQDNTRVNGSAKLSSLDSIAFYSRLYSTKALYAGHVAAPLSVTATGVHGEVGWRKPAQTKGIYWRTGLVAILETESSPWVATRGVPVLAPGTRTFRLENPLSSTDEEYAVDFSAQGKFVIPANSRKLKLSINRTTGVLTGSCLEVGRPRTFQGIMLQTQGVGGGFVPGMTEILEWELLPPAP